MPSLRNLAAAAALAALGCASGPPPESRLGASAETASVAATRPSASGLLGAYLDKQALELGAIPDADVTRRDDALVVSMSGGVLFADSSSAMLSPGGAERVRQLARTVQVYPKQRIIVKGHTDGEGNQRSNQRLSEDRADTVRNLLVAEGVLPSHVTAVGLGADLPLATNSTAEGRQQNRRVEIELRPDADVIQAPAPQ
jgi:outer membrane protein OmpA-like peptidoglycan-associated protein